MAQPKTQKSYDGLKGNVIIQKSDKSDVYTSLYSSATKDEVLDLSKVMNNSASAPGYIAMFSGASIPTGWVLCDGTNGTPNLNDVFIMGSSSTDLTIKGSHNSVVVSHTHTIKLSAVGKHSHTANPGNATSKSGGKHTHKMRKEKNETVGTACNGYYDDTDTRYTGAFRAWANLVGVVGVVGGINFGTSIVAKTSTSGKSPAHRHYLNLPAFNVSGHGVHKHKITIPNAGVATKDRNKPPYYELVYIQKT